MKKHFMLLSAGLSAAVLSGCTIIRQTPEVPSVVSEKKDLPEFNLCRDLISAFLKNNGRAFTNLLPDSMKKQFTREKFSETRKAVLSSMGQPVSYRFVTRLESTAVTPYIWAIRFERTSTRDQKVYHTEVLFRVITGTLDGKPYIIGFNFM